MRLNNIFLKILAGVFALCLVLAGCARVGDDDKSEPTESTESTAKETEINYNGVVAADYVKSVTYKNIEVELESEDTQKDKALWQAIYTSAQLEDYPEDKVEYYFNQTKKAYMYIAGNNQEDYELLLQNRGTDEQEMRAEARSRVLEDLVYRYILEKENIVLTAEDKAENFDKYVEKLARDIEKSENYVISTLAEYVYEIMLYDKTTEYLMTVNTFELRDTFGESAGKGK